MMENNGGLIWEIDYDACISCNYCYRTAPDFTTLDGNGLILRYL